MTQRSYNTMSTGRSMDPLTQDENGSFWKRRTKAERILIVACVILAIVIIALVIALAVISNKRSGPGETITEIPPEVTTATQEECGTDVCKTAADMFITSINESVNPCDDFYSYVCSGWQAANPIPDKLSSLSTFSVLEENIINDLKEVLPNSTFEASDVRTKTKNFYLSCINNETRESKGVEPLKAVLEELGGWPLLGKELGENYIWEEVLANAIRQFSTRPIIVVNVDADAKNTTRNLIQLDQTGLGIGRNALIDTNKTDERAQEIITAYKKLIRKSAQLLNSTKNEEELNADIEEMLHFERQLATSTRSVEERRDPNSLYNNMTVSDLQLALEDKIDIALLLSRVFENVTEVNGNTLIIVREFNYLSELATLLSSMANMADRTIANFIGWNIVQNFGGATTQEFRDAVLEFDKVVSGVQEATPLDESCIKSTNSFFDFALGSVFINSNFDIETKAEIENMIKEMKVAFSELLGNNTWMNKESKERAKHKLDEMIPMVAFPPWINDTEKLNEYYQKLGPISEDTFFENAISLAKFFSEKNFETINELNNRSEEWVTGPAIVNAFYNPNANTITFPAGILKNPFYQVGLPPALNFAGIGSVIGHEITHGFDDEGSQYDAEGNLQNWWPSEVRERFRNETKCFVEQYESFKEPKTGMNLNGENTLGENIGDNGGIREAFKAYKSYEAKIGKNLKLPGLNLTSDQLFFVSYSYVWCANSRPEYLEDIIQYNPHSPPRFRVQIPCSNTEEFSQAFNCPADSTMNPEHKCVVW